MNDKQLEELISNNKYWVKGSDQGLYNEYYELVRHADVSKDAKRLGVDEATLHRELIRVAKSLQLERQRKIPAQEIFQGVTEYLKNKEYPSTLGAQQIKVKLVSDLIEAFDEAEISVMSNERRSFLLPSKPGSFSFKRAEVISLFQGWIELVGVGDTVSTVSDATSVMNLFLSKVVTR